MVHLLIEHYKNHMTKEQLERVADLFKYNDSDLIIGEVTQSYNCYVNTHSKETSLLITNPDALFRTHEQEKAFIAELKKYIMDVVLEQPRRKEKEDGTDNSNRTNQTVIKNRG